MSSSGIPVDILEVVLPKLGIKVPVSKIIEAVNVESAKRHAVGAMESSSNFEPSSDMDYRSNTLVKEPESKRELNQFAREFDASFPNGKMSQRYSDDPPLQNHS